MIKQAFNRFGELMGQILVPVLCLGIFALSAVISGALVLGKYAIAYQLLSRLAR